MDLTETEAIKKRCQEYTEKLYKKDLTTSWQIDRKQWKQCQTLFLEGSKIIADGDCSHEIKRHLVLGRKVMTNLESIFKSRDIALSTKIV